MLTNIPVFVIVFGVTCFLATSGVNGIPSVGTFRSNGGNIGTRGYSASQLNTICSQLANQKYDPPTRYGNLGNVTGKTDPRYFRVLNTTHGRTVDMQAPALICDIGEETERCVSTTDSVLTFDYWKPIQTSYGPGCSHLGSFTVNFG